MRLGCLAKFATSPSAQCCFIFWPRFQQELAVRFGATSPPFDVRIFALVAECSDVGCRVDHRLLIVCNEAGAGPIKIQNKEYDSRYQHSHDVDW